MADTHLHQLFCDFFVIAAFTFILNKHLSLKLQQLQKITAVFSYSDEMRTEGRNEVDCTKYESVIIFLQK